MLNTFSSRFSWLRLFFGLSFVTLGLASSAQAQQSRFALEYPMTIPYGDTKDFIDETSYEGLGFSSFFPTGGGFSFGFSFQWIGWDKSKRLASYNQDGATVSGNEDKEYNAYPLLLQGRYELPMGIFKPYAGIGAGIAYVEEYQRLGFIYNDDYATQGIIAPELGVYLDFKTVEMGLGSQYLASFTDSDPASLQGLTIRLSLGFATE